MNAAAATNLGTIVLCGGRSRRMGRPKQDLALGPATLLDRVLATASLVGDPVIAVAQPDDPRDFPAGVVVIRDTRPGGGPLTALADGLAHMPQPVDIAAVLGCDVPFVTGEVIRAMQVSLREEDDALVPLVAGRPQWMTCLLRTRTLPRLQRLLDRGERSMHSLADACDCRLVPAEELIPSDLVPHVFRNLNTPYDYAEALAALRQL